MAGTEPGRSRARTGCRGGSGWISGRRARRSGWPSGSASCLRSTRRSWLDGGETSLENTVLACRRHHRALHEHGFSLEWVGEALSFRDPSGQVVPAQGPRTAIAVDLAAVAEAWRGVPVTAEVNAPGWDGDRVDYDLCVAALA